MYIKYFYLNIWHNIQKKVILGVINSLYIGSYHSHKLLLILYNRQYDVSIDIPVWMEYQYSWRPGSLG